MRSLVLASVLLSALGSSAAPPAPVFATREQYKACTEAQELLTARRASADKALRENNRDMAEHQEKAKAVLAQQPAADERDESKIEDFNRKIDELNRVGAELNQRADAGRKDQDQFNADVAAHNRTCGALVYRLSDRDAVDRERQGRKPRP